MLITIAFSVIGVLGDYFLKLASAKEQSLRTVGFILASHSTRRPPSVGCS